MPSFINDLLLKDVKALVERSSSMIIVDPSKLKSGESLALRKNLNGVGAKMKVAKVNLLRLAVPQGTAPFLEGKTTIALIVAPDMIGAAKILAGLEKEEKLTFKGGVFDGEVIGADGIKRLASMPDKQTLRGMLVNVLAAPLVGLARVIAEIEKKQKGAG